MYQKKYSTASGNSSSKQQAASEILHFQCMNLELAVSQGRLNLCHKAIKTGCSSSENT